MVLTSDMALTTCRACGKQFEPAPHITRPETCGEPECLRVYRRFLRREGRPVAMAVQDYHRILDVLKKRGERKAWTIIYVIGQTGLRVGELVLLRPKDFHFDGPVKLLAVPTFSMKGHPRILHKVSGTVAGILETWARENKVPRDAFLFRCSKRTVQNIFKSAVKEAGLGNKYTIRSLRHMYGLMVARATEDPKVVMTALRERDVRSSAVYLNMVQEMDKEMAHDPCGARRGP